jgi:hypothetical protein
VHPRGAPGGATIPSSGAASSLPSRDHRYAVWREIVETTKDWSSYWLDDREFARRPWVTDKRYNAVDKLLSTAPHFADRIFPEQDAIKRILPAAWFAQ